MRAPFQRFHSFATKLAAGVFVNALNADTDVLRVYLSNEIPDLAAMAEKADLPEITNEHGYAGPIDTQNAALTEDGVITVAGTGTTVRASGGSVGPFRCVVLYDDSVAGGPLIGVWDYDALITLRDGETFLIGLDVLFDVGA